MTVLDVVHIADSNSLYSCIIGVITFSNECGKFELEVTTFQMSVLYAWNDRPGEEISLEAIRLSTQLPDTELRRTLWVCIYRGWIWE